MALFVPPLAQRSHLQRVEMNGDSWQLWLSVEQMAEEWPLPPPEEHPLTYKWVASHQCSRPLKPELCETKEIDSLQHVRLCSETGKLIS